MTQSYFKQVPDFEYVNRTKGNTNISSYITVKNLFKRGKIRPDIFGDLNFFTKYKIIGDDRPDNIAFKEYGDSNLDWVILLANNILNIQDEWPLPQNSLDEILLEKYGTYDKLYSDVHHYETVEIKNSKGGIILPGGLETPNKWRTNGNYIQAINTKINQISGTESKIATVTMYNGIKNLDVGSEVYITNISSSVYNGRFPITSVLKVGEVVIRFTYVLPSIPENKQPEILGSEEVTFTVEGTVGTGNAYYYEYYDNNSYHTIPVAKMTQAVTNYEYEIAKEDDKRNIFILKPEYLNVIFNDMDKIMPYKKGAAQYVNNTLKKGENINLYQ
jgi:hypothetical protein|tara:strand:+ start:697 stop:1689 length:993 start_codon:yes stop_codon:yes gene_type:complete